VNIYDQNLSIIKNEEEENDDNNNITKTNEDDDTTQKSPMFLINEVARYNKLQLQYQLLDETGPAHNKIFFVKLKLGIDEEYEANGSSIKKAQQAAAKNALANTKYQTPQKRKKENISNCKLLYFFYH
jgi:dsRNA-specific ribonuclease